MERPTAPRSPSRRFPELTSDIELSRGDWIVRVAPEHGGRIAQIVYKETHLLVDESRRTADRVHLWGCFPMVPWAGRLRNGMFAHRGVRYSTPVNEPPHALHGLATTRAWTVVDRSSSNESTSITMALNLDGTDRVAPFHAYCEHAVSIDDGGVRASLSVRSHGEDFPAVLGWHPWFTRALTYEVDFETMLERDDDNIVTTSRVNATHQHTPSSNRAFDDCFTDVRRPPRLRLDDTSIQLDSDCSHWMLYTAPDHAFCLEPMSGPPDSLDDSHPDRFVVSPDNPLQRVLRLRTV